MRTFDPCYFIRLARSLEQLSAMSAKAGRSFDPISDSETELLIQMIEGMRAPLQNVDLGWSISLLDRMIASLDGELKYIDLAYLVNGLAMRIEDELKSAIILQIPRDRSKYYGEKQLFGSNVSAKFPNVSDDLEEASNCIAVGRYTASVFHIMRVLEVGLQALASKLSISVAKDRNWQAILNDVQGAIKKLPQSTRQEKDLREKCQAVHAHLQSVKDAWRNGVMHPRASYSEEQAKDVIENSRALMVKIAEIV